MNKKVINIRPHHGLCTLFFEGKGYSEEFVENLWKVVRAFEEDVDINIVSGADDICSACPNKKSDCTCESEENVNSYDKKVLELIGLKEMDKISYNEFKEIVKDNIIKKDKLKDICSGCQWYYICKDKVVK